MIGLSERSLWDFECQLECVLQREFAKFASFLHACMHCSDSRIFAESLFADDREVRETQKEAQRILEDNLGVTNDGLCDGWYKGV